MAAPRYALSAFAALALAALLTACGGGGGGGKSSGSATKDSELARIESPATGAVVTGAGVRVVIRTGPGARAPRAWLGQTEITHSLRQGPSGTWTTELARGRLLRLGLNELSVRTSASGGHEDFDSASFVVARRVPPLLTVTEVRTGSSESPIKVTVRAPRDSTLRATVNGHSADQAFFATANGVLVGRLGANDGLRLGRNRISVLAFTENGDYDADSRTVELTRSNPVAAAGPDRRVRQGDTVALDGRGSQQPSGAAAGAYRWQITRAPPGSRAKVQGAGSATASLRPDRPGTYEARVTVGRSHDTVRLQVAAADPPIGAAIRTVADDQGRITIRGQPVAGTGGGSNSISYAVVDRSTGEIQPQTEEGSGSFPTAGGVPKLVAIANRYNHAPGYLMVVNAPKGIEPSDFDAFASFLGKVGGPQITPSDKQALTNRGPFSLVGLPGAPQGSAFVKIPTNGGAPAVADMPGYFQTNITTGDYGFVYTEYVPVDTQAGAPSATQSTIKVGSASYTQQLPAGYKAGFHVLALGSKSLRVTDDPDANQVLATNTTAPDPGTEKIAQQRLADVLKRLSSRVDRPLIVIQSIGKPSRTTEAWTAIANQIAVLGGNARQMDQLHGTPADFNALDGTGGYALIGRAGLTAPAPEAVEPLTRQPGKLKGVVARNRSSDFEPLVVDPYGQVNNELLQIAYQAPRPFPAFNDAESRAETWIGRQVKLCKSTDTTCDFRSLYYENFRGSWPVIHNDLLNLKTNCPAGDRYTATDCEHTRSQLYDEVGALRRVRDYMDGLQAPFGRPGLTAELDLKDIGQKISASVAPTQDRTTTNTFQLLSHIAALGKIIPGAGQAAGALSAVFSFGAYLSQPRGAPNLGPIDAKVSELSGKVLDSFSAASAQIELLGKMVVSDYGKLNAVADNVDTAEWRLGDASAVEAELRKASQRFYYQSLMPTGYLLFWLDPPPPAGPVNARDFFTYGGRPKRKIVPFQNEPDSGQYRPTVSVQANGTPVSPVFALRAFQSPNTPPPSLTDPLVASARDPKGPGLGFFPSQIYSPRNYTVYGIK